MQDRRHPLTDQLLSTKIIVILRGLSPANALESARILADEGIRFMEVPLNTPDALESIRILAGYFRKTEIRIGAGTVRTPEGVSAVADAGGGYIISPDTREDVIRKTRELGLLSIPGFATPTEAFLAMDSGAHILKQFPCESPEQIAVLKSVIPLPILAVGGIDRNNIRAYLKTADGAGVGIGIYRPDMTPEALRESAHNFMKELK